VGGSGALFLGQAKGLAHPGCYAITADNLFRGSIMSTTSTI
jgi:hypothetical protein